MFPSKISQNIKLQFFSSSIFHIWLFSQVAWFFLGGKKVFLQLCLEQKKMYSIKGLIRAKLLGSGQFRRVKAPERTIGCDLRGWYIYDHRAVCHLLHNRADSTLVKSIKPTVRGCSTAQTRDKPHAKICFQECTFEMGG